MFEALTMMNTKFEDSTLLEYDPASPCNQFLIFQRKSFSFKMVGTAYPEVQCHIPWKPLTDSLKNLQMHTISKSLICGM
jgi:hypothetical protein